MLHCTASTTFCLTPMDGAPEIPVGPAPLILGRDPACAVRLDSPMVSRHHCRLTESAGVVLAQDLGSTNGTRVNGRRVTLRWLQAGDELSVAHLRFRLLRRPDADPLRRPGHPDDMSDAAMWTSVPDTAA